MSATLNDMPDRINRFSGIPAPAFGGSQVTVGSVFRNIVLKRVFQCTRISDVRAGSDCALTQRQPRRIWYLAPMSFMSPTNNISQAQHGLSSTGIIWRTRRPFTSPECACWAGARKLSVCRCSEQALAVQQPHAWPTSRSPALR